MTATTATRPEAPSTGSLTLTRPEGVPTLNPKAAASLLKLVQAAKTRIDAREAP